MDPDMFVSSFPEELRNSIPIVNYPPPVHSVIEKNEHKFIVDGPAKIIASGKSTVETVINSPAIVRATSNSKVHVDAHAPTVVHASKNSTVSIHTTTNILIDGNDYSNIELAIAEQCNSDVLLDIAGNSTVTCSGNTSIIQKQYKSGDATIRKQ